MVQMTKNLVHTFYHILYQPKGVPTPRDNFSGTVGMSFSLHSAPISRHYNPLLFRNRFGILTIHKAKGHST